MLPPPPPFLYTHHTLTGLCNRLSAVLQPWTYPNGLLHCHWVNSSPQAAHTTVRRHSHCFHEGFILLSGAVNLITPWETQYLEAGSLLLLTPGTVHQWQTQQQACHWLVLSFDLDHPLVTPPHQHWPQCPELLWSVLLLCETVQSAQEGWALRANSHLGVVYATLLNLLESPATSEPTLETTPQLVRRIDELLNAHLATPMTLEELAAEVSMSARHLTRCYRTHTGMTIHDRQEALRLERAAQLLRRTNLPITEIAHAVGISNAAYLAGRFWQRFSLTPREFRRRGLAGEYLP